MGPKILLAPNSPDHYGYRICLKDSLKNFFPEQYEPSLDDFFSKKNYEEPKCLKTTLENNIIGMYYGGLIN